MLGCEADRPRLDVAIRLGADAAIAGGRHDLDPRNGRWTRADVVIDAAGVSASLKASLDIIRPGGQITKVGWGPQPLDSRWILWSRKRQPCEIVQPHLSHLGGGIGAVSQRRVNLDPIIGAVERWRIGSRLSMRCMIAR